MQHQADNSASQSHYQYYLNPAAAAAASPHPPSPFASAPPVSPSDYSSYPSLPANSDHLPAPHHPQSSVPYSFPHLQNSSSHDQNPYHPNLNTPVNYDYYATYTNPNPVPDYSPSTFSNSYSDGPSAYRDHANSFENSVNYVDQGLYDGGVYKYNGGRVDGGRSSEVGTGGGILFDDYGRPITNNIRGKEMIGSGNSSHKVVKAVPKSEDFQGSKSGGVQKFRVKMLSEGFGQTDVDVMCQIGLDGIRILDPATSLTLKIYPLHNVSKWEVLDSYIFAFWASTSVDPDLKRIRLKSSSYTTNIILDMVTAASIQSKEMGPTSNPSELAKGIEQSGEKKKGFLDWKNLIKPANEEKDHWVPDEAVTKCTACGTDFNAFNRKHHCRNCGEIFCDKCTQGRIALTTDESAQPVRVCDSCMAEATQRLSNIKEAPARVAGLQSHEDLARKLQVEMDRKRKTPTGMKSEASGTRMREVACPTCTVHLQVQVPFSGSETIECSVCQHPFLVNAH